MCYPFPPLLSLSLFGAITRPSQYNYLQHPRCLSPQHSDDRRSTNKVGNESVSLSYRTLTNRPNPTKTGRNPTARVVTTHRGSKISPFQYQGVAQEQRASRPGSRTDAKPKPMREHTSEPTRNPSRHPNEGLFPKGTPSQSPSISPFYPAPY